MICHSLPVCARGRPGSLPRIYAALANLVRVVHTALPPSSHLPVLVVVEGPHDVEFLKRISRVLHAEHEELPDLAQLERRRQILFLPIGGNGPLSWTERLGMLGKAEYHLYDRETPPESQVREQAVQRLPPRWNRVVQLTAKRSLENYLHPQAVRDVCGLEITLGDADPVAEVVARRILESRHAGVTWDTLTIRTRKRLREQAKRWLNRAAVNQMTSALLAERDPDGEVASWLRAIARLVRGSS